MIFACSQRFRRLLDMRTPFSALCPFQLFLYKYSFLDLQKDFIAYVLVVATSCPLNIGFHFFSRLALLRKLLARYFKNVFRLIYIWLDIISYRCLL